MQIHLRPAPSSVRCEAPGQEPAPSAGASVFHKGKLNMKISPKARKGRKGRRGADPGVLTQGCLLDRWEQRSLSSCQSSRREGQKDRQKDR